MTRVEGTIETANWRVDDDAHFFNVCIRDGKIGKIVFGGFVNVSPFVSILAAELIEIGEGTLIACGASIVDHDHEMNDPEKINEIGIVYPVKIGRKCWIGSNASVLKGVELEDYCVVGAGSVVTKGHYPKGSVLVGNPAKIIRTRKI